MSTGVTPTSDLLAEAIRGFLLEKHLPVSELDAWADELAAIVAEHNGSATEPISKHNTQGESQ